MESLHWTPAQISDGASIPQLIALGTAHEAPIPRDVLEQLNEVRRAKGMPLLTGK